MTVEALSTISATHPISSPAFLIAFAVPPEPRSLIPADASP